MNKQRIYRTDLGMYAFQTFIYGLPLFVCVFLMFQRGFTTATLKDCLICVLFPLAAVLWLSRYRLIIDATHLRYRSWSLREAVILLHDISSVTVFNATPIAGIPINTHVNLVDGSFVSVFTKTFSRNGIKALYALDPSGPNNSFKPNPLRGFA